MLITNENSVYLEWYEYQPLGNVVVVRSRPDKLKTETESGIIISTQESKETIAPYYGEVVSIGKDVTEVEVGNIIYFPPQNAFPVEMIRTISDEKYLMTTSDRIDAIKVVDVRK